MSEKTHEERLQKANQFVFAKASDVKNTTYRQRYHFMAPAGWMNDPNGLIQINGEYHLFYQHNPYSAKWGAMHWGHAVSNDLVHWRHLPIALAPSESYDDCEHGGCFSGSAIENKGKLYLFYTGVCEKNGIIQRQCIAYSSDGVHFKKYRNNPVIREIPPEGSADFRDPKVWRHGDFWYMVVGSCKNGNGKALLFRSSDLKQWSYFSVMSENKGEAGTMWECPDFFSLGDTDVLMFSPIGLKEKKTLYFIGRMDYTSGRFLQNSMGEIDFGFDFYAPQTFLDAQGRHILLGWANSWEWMPWWRGFGKTQRDGWCGSMCLPRTITLGANGKLCFTPVRELKKLRTGYTVVEKITVSQEKQVQLSVGDGISYEIEAEIDLASSNTAAFGFLLRNAGPERTVIKFDCENEKLVFDRTHSDDCSGGLKSSPLKMENDKKFQVHIFVDTCSVEIFINGGQTVMSGNIYPASSYAEAFFFVENGYINVNIIKTWQLSSIW